jgi:hypothetical protein
VHRLCPGLSHFALTGLEKTKWSRDKIIKRILAAHWQPSDPLEIRLHDLLSCFDCYLAVTFNRTNRLPVGLAGKAAWTVRLVPLSATMCWVTPVALQEPGARVSLHSTS